MLFALLMQSPTLWVVEPPGGCEAGFVGDFLCFPVVGAVLPWFRAAFALDVQNVIDFVGGWDCISDAAYMDVCGQLPRPWFRQAVGFGFLDDRPNRVIWSAGVSVGSQDTL